VINEVPWFSNLIGALCSDYKCYNELIHLLLSRTSNPLQSRLNEILSEEKRLSRKIIRQEQIISGWLKEAPVLLEKASVSLRELGALRKESAELRIRGSESLKSGMKKLEQEKERVRGNISLKTNRKEAAPRLIDIKL